MNRNQSGSVSVTARNVRFPCFLQWTVNQQTKTIELPTGETTVELPFDGPVTLFCRPYKTSSWMQSVQVWVSDTSNEPYSLGRLLGRAPLTLNDKDKLTVFFEDPIPPWNAVCVPLRGESILVTLERPQADYDVDKWLAKNWQGTEEFPNTALCWSRYGSAGLADELAAYFVSHRNGTEHWFSFRGARHTSLVVQTNGPEDVSIIMQEITQEDLAVELTKAFELLRLKMSPNGKTVEDEINRAAEILRSEMQ